MKGNCIICKKEYKTYPCLLDRKKYCGIICRQKDQTKNLLKFGKNTRFKKGQEPYNKKGFSIKKTKNNRYYKLVYTPYHPFASKKGYVPEHRLIIEKQIGRYLQKTEVVHYIDNDGLNNDINNLQLMTQKDHMKLHTKDNVHKRWQKITN